MAKSRKKKGKKKRANTTLPSVTEGKNDRKIKRAKSIPPINQQKQHRKTLTTKKPLRPIEENAKPSPARKSAPPSTSITDAFSKLSITSNQKNKTETKRRFSTDTTATNGSSGDKKRDKLEYVAKLIKSGKAKNIIIMAGAGISTGSGIPDFRTPGTGLYDNLQKYKIPNPMAIFDMDYFHYDPKPFFTLAKELYPSGKYKPCPPHYLAKLLHDKGLLLRMYTQNIDGLERIAGLPPEKLVEAHGTFSSATCTKCGKKHDGIEIKKKVLEGVVPRCRSSGLCWGIVKPDIVFFGEDLPRRFYYYLKDFPQCDLLIIMGTSLEVEPFASLTSSVRSFCPRILLNRELVGPFKKKSQRRPHDVGVKGDLTEIINRLVEHLGWKENLQKVIKQTKYDEENIQSDTVSTDSGVSSIESSAASTSNKSQLPPVNGDIKRYFHTIRSTPLPKQNSLYVSNSAKDGSYYGFIQKETMDGIRRSNSPVKSFNSSLTIQYANKTFAKTVSKRKIPTFGIRYARSDTSSDASSDDEASSSASSGSSDESSV